MKKNISLILLLLTLVCRNGYSQTTIVSEDFENSLSLFTVSSGSGAFYSGVSGVNDRPSGSPFSFLNTYSFGVTNGNVVIVSNPVDVSAYTSIQMKFRLAAFSIANPASGLDIPDEVAISVSPDGGATYYPTSIVRGNTNAWWSYAGGTANASTPYDGDLSAQNFAPGAGGQRTTDGYSTVTITSLPQVSNLRVSIAFLNNFDAERWVIDNFEITGIPVTGPLINVYPFSLSGFSSVSGNPSSENTYHVRGSNLTNNISINAPAGFQISATSGSGFGSSLTLTQTGGNVALSTVYVRMNSAVAGSNTGVISNSSTGATIKNINVSGTVLAVEPTVSSTVSFINILANSMDVNFTGGNGAGRIVVMRPGSAITSVPTDGADYTANSVFGAGSFIGPDQYVVYKGNGSTVNVAALNASTTYYAAVFEYNDAGIVIARNYYAVPGTGNATTLVIAEGLELTATNSIFTIDFDNTVARVNNGAFAGVNINTTPAAGHLNSNAWSISGTNYSGPAVFGGSFNTGGGIAAGNVTTGTYYAFEPVSGNRALGIQPTAAYWTPGYITLRLQNNTGAAVDSLAIAYKLYILNNENLGNDFSFEYSLDNLAYYSANLADTSLAIVADGSPVWKLYLRSALLSGFSLPNGANLYLRWKGDAGTGTGNNDEFALDDISMVANPVTIYPGIAGNFENITVQGTIQLSGNASVAGNVRISNGSIELGNNNLTIGGTATGSQGGYLKTNGTGTVTINNISSARLFPVGTSRYNPLTISNGSNLNWTAKLTTGIINPQSPLVANEAVLRTWTITPSVNPPPSGANLTFEYNDGDPTQLAAGFNNTRDVQVWHYNGTNWSAASSALTPTGTPGGIRNVTLSNWLLYSSFTIANISGTLPVRLTSVKAEETANGIKISWINLSESNVYFYQVERSDNGNNFISVGRVNAFVNNGGGASYNWTDISPLTGAGFYRIISIEADGQKNYSSVIKIDIGKTKPEINIYPNPVYGSQPNLTISDFPKGDYFIKVFAANGQQVHEELIIHKGGAVAIPIQISSSVKPGLYYVSVEGGQLKLQTKLIVQ